MVRRLHIGHAWRREPAYDSDQDNGDADDVKNVDSQQISPWRVGAAEKKFLQAKEHPEAPDFGSAQNRAARRLRRCDSLLQRAGRNQRKRNSDSKEKERRGQGST